MKDKINVAELLRNCPKGMELYSPIYGNGILTKVTDRIHVKFPKEHNVKCFRPDGRVSEDGEIMIFPKGKTTWEGFVPPCKFKDGDIIFTRGGKYNWVSIFKQFSGSSCCTYVDLYINDNDLFPSHSLCNIEDITTQRIATEEEKQKLFDAIKANGYKWNEKTKTLEKLPKFKVGDKITFKCEKDKPIISITGVKDNYYFVQYFNITKNDYQNEKISFEFQDNYKLVLDKFDINTLVPFESRVLIRDYNYEEWKASFWGYLTNNFYGFNYDTIRGNYKQCIPYEGNEHLLGTNDDCDEYFKTWK